MRKKHVVALMMATVMAVSVLGGCGGSSSSGKAAKSSSNSDEKVLNFGCAMYTDGSVNTAGDEERWLECNALRYYRNLI